VIAAVSTFVAPGLVEHPEEKLEEGAAGLRPESVEHRPLLGFWNAIQTQHTGKIEVRIDHGLPERAKPH